MKNHNLQIIFLIIAISASAFMFSSHKNINIDERALIHAIGVDYDEENKIYKVTLQIFKPQGTGSDTPVDPSKINMQIVTGEGVNISDALNQCQYEYGRELFMGHLQVIAFGKTVDFSNPEDLFSYTLTNKNIFLGVKLCIADKTAEDLLSTQITRETMVSEIFNQTIEMNDRYGTTINCELLDFLSSIKTHQYIAIPVISVKQPEQKEESSQQGGEQSEGQSDPVLQINETAIIKDGKILPDRLSVSESIGASWLSGKTKECKIVVYDNGEHLYALITKDSSQIKLVNENGRLTYKVNISVVAHPAKDIADQAQEQRFSELVEETLTQYCQSAAMKAIKQNQADIFGIWKRLRQSYPESYLEYQDDLSYIYDIIEFDINFKVRTA